MLGVWVFELCMVNQIKSTSKPGRALGSQPSSSTQASEVRCKGLLRVDRSLRMSRTKTTCCRGSTRYYLQPQGGASAVIDQIKEKEKFTIR